MVKEKTVMAVRGTVALDATVIVEEKATYQGNTKIIQPKKRNDRIKI